MELYSDELYHWGKKGMKWGVRRYQNKDGSLTDAGRRRYARDAREKEYDQYDSEKGSYYKRAMVSDAGFRSCSRNSKTAFNRRYSCSE